MSESTETPKSGVVGVAEVLKAEATEISAQRKNREAADASADAVGLAISGGGIRSATFALGVLQALKGMHLLKRIDYLSTVSGGGYIGAWFMANRLEKSGAAAKAPEDDFLGSQSPEIGHLRRFSSYLTPRTGFLSSDTWTAVCIWLRNTLSLQFMLAVFLVGVLLIPHFWSAIFDWLAELSVGNARWFFGIHITILLLIGVCLLMGMRGLGRGEATERLKRVIGKRLLKWHGELDAAEKTKGMAKAVANSANAAQDVWLWLVGLRRRWRCFWEFAIIGLSLIGALLMAPALWKWTENPATVPHFELQGALKRAEAAAVHLADAPEDALKREYAEAAANLKSQLAAANAASEASLTPTQISQLRTARAQAQRRLDTMERLVQTALASDRIQHPEDAAAVAALRSEAPPALNAAELEAIDRWVSEGTTLELGWYAHDQRVWGLGIAIAVVLLVMRVLQRGQKWSHGMMRLAVQFVCVMAAYMALFAAVLILFSLFREVCAHLNWCGAAAHNLNHVNEMTEVAAIFGTPLVLSAYALLIGFSISLCGVDLEDQYREWWARIGAWICIVCVARAGLWLVALKGPDLVHYVLNLEWKVWSAILGWLGTTAVGLLAANSENTDGRTGKSRILELAATIAPYVFILGLLLCLSCLTQWFLMEATGEAGASLPRWLHDKLPSVGVAVTWLTYLTIEAHWLFAWVAATGFITGLLLLLANQFDINELSMNQFYRNRLMRCYLGGSKPPGSRKPHAFTGLDVKDDRVLCDFLAQGNHPASSADAAPKAFPGPFWIVNTALNTAKEPDLEVAERLAESFVFTPLHCGFFRRGFGDDAGHAQPGGRPFQGFLSSEEYCAATASSTVKAAHETETYVSAAFAITASGAAASPNSGYHTAPAIAFLMTVFNARLGWWVPNPTCWKLRHNQPRFMARYVLAELFGRASAKDDYIYVSDGGHFENLGLYELVRRRCKLIIVSDAEQDGDYTFHALGTAIRRCYVDFDAKIEIDISGIAPAQPGGLSRNHCAVGTITYPPPRDDAPEETGWLVYLKASLTGDEETDVKQYRALNPAFPHHSTADQWFSESQFESYRRLGQHVAEESLSSTLRFLQGQASADTLGRALSDYWTPSSAGATDAFVRNTEALLGIWRDMARDMSLRFLDPLMLPQPATGAAAADIKLPTDERRLRAGSYICQRLFQLMENVYLDLNLKSGSDHPDQSGWMQLFDHWLKFDYFSAEWEKTKTTYGSQFQAFWQHRREQLKTAEQKNKPIAKAAPGAETF